jgi:uncharacterized membrane protein YbaN (DUF454 family)
LQSKGVTKYCLIFLGLFLIGLGLVGIIIPGLPTTVFLIIAAACFAKSSPGLHAWLMCHPWFGPILTHWQQTRSIPKKSKFIALLSMMIAAVYSSVMLSNNYLIAAILITMLFPAIFLLRLPLSEELPLREKE